MGLSGAKRDGNPFSPMSESVSRRDAASRNPSSILVGTSYCPPSESPDSTRLLGPIWTASGLTLQEGVRLYCGDHWRSGWITATGETFAIIKTREGVSRCSDRRNLLVGEEEARLFKNAQARFKRQRQAVLNSVGTCQEEEENHG